MGHKEGGLVLIITVFPIIALEVLVKAIGSPMFSNTMVKSLSLSSLTSL